MAIVKTEDLVKIFNELSEQFEEMNCTLDVLSSVLNLDKFFEESGGCNDSNECKCKPKTEKKEELKSPKELTLGEFIVIEALSKKLIPDTLNKEEMLDAITNCIIHNPIIKLFDSCAVNLCNEEKVQSEFAKFADCYCNLMSIVLSALRQVDISKLRIK